MPTLSRPSETSTAPQRDSAARNAGLLLLLTAAASALMAFARVSADADQPTLLESLHVIAVNKAMYSISGAARLASGLTLLAAAWFLLRAWSVRERMGAPLVPYLFIASGVFTALSGLCALGLAASTPSASEAATLAAVDPSTEVMAYLRWLTGKIGFAAAGLALLGAARSQWAGGGAMRRIAPVSALIGAAMQFIWIDAATLMHQIVGIAFFAWLVLMGAMLAMDKRERRFAGERDAS